MVREKRLQQQQQQQQQQQNTASTASLADSAMTVTLKALIPICLLAHVERGRALVASHCVSANGYASPFVSLASKTGEHSKSLWLHPDLQCLTQIVRDAAFLLLAWPSSAHAVCNSADGSERTLELKAS